MRKQLFLLGFLVLLILGVIYGGIFVSKHLPGVLPLLLKPPVDIAEVIDDSSDTTSSNHTKFPLSLPEGISISIFAKALGSPRVLAFDPSGHLVTSITKQGSVVVLPDRDKDGVADEVLTLTSNLNNPHGLAFNCELDELGVEQVCKLYVAETDKIVSYDYDRTALSVSNEKVLVDLPAQGGGHFTRTLLLDDSSKELLISVGSSCNVCSEEDKRRAAIVRLDLESGESDIYARGLRNAVFMAEHPHTGQLWVTEMGRDLLGDDIPPDEINIVEMGKHYGWPTCYGKNVHDTDFDGDTVYIRAPCTEPFEQPSHIDIEAHSAPLGLTFVPARWGEKYKDDLLVSYHGSWNRSVPTGYKIMRFDLDSTGTYLGREDFITGWLTEESGVLGRPVDLLFDHEGVLHVSDDRAGVIYRVVRN